MSMNLTLYQVDAFTNDLFKGNPAAVIFSDLNDPKLMQQIAFENNLSETAFIFKKDDEYYIRWFAPLCEVDLCGHATLASGFIFFNYIKPEASEFVVNSKKNGILKVIKKSNKLFLDFPIDDIHECEETTILEKCFGKKPNEVFQGRDDILCIYNDENFIRNLNPDFNLLKDIENTRGFIVSAPGDNYDFASRCFFPITGVDEDPVTGSAHTTLSAYWSKKLKKTSMNAVQLSSRGGELECYLENDRVFIGGNAKLFMKGTIYI